MKTAKRTLSIILSILVMLSFSCNISLFAQAATEVQTGNCGENGGNNLTFVLDSDGVLTISGSGRMKDYSRLTNRAPWYNNADQIKKVVLESEVINVGAYAFNNCKNLVEVDYGNIDTIGVAAFLNCESLYDALLPKRCTYIWANAFEGCKSLRRARIEEIKSNDSKALTDSLFKDCSSLTVLKLGSGVNSLSSSSLSGCSSLKNIISANVTSSDYNILRLDEETNACSGVCSDNTYSSQNLTWNYEMDSESLWFTGSGDMNYYAVGERPWDMFDGFVKSIDFSQTDGRCSTTSDSFKDYSNVETLDLTNIYSVGWRSFGDCSLITSIAFDSCLNEIWDWAFERCYALDHITFENGSEPLHIRQHAFYNCKNTTYWLNFPTNIKYIDEGAFKGTKFNYITFSNTEKVEIGDNAFGTTDRDFYLRMITPDGVDIGVKDYVNEMRLKYRYNWYCFCKNGNHVYESSTVAPTCTKDGYSRYGCKYCMQNEYRSDYVAKLGHNYQCSGTDGGNMTYQCTVCGDENFCASSIELENGFLPAISSVAGNSKFNQDNYSSKIDVNVDGVINAKDFAMITKAVNDIRTDNKETTIDTSRTYQEIEGFGASACWWAQEVGEWENAEEIMEMLYSEENGIGLDIYRYNLGAGSEDQKDYGLYNSGSRTHCFMKSDGTYDWNNDTGAMHCLELAQQFNPDLKLTLFSNSAPYFMTKNGKTYSTQDTDGPSNLDSSKYQDFANFTVTCAEHFIDEGYNVTEVSPINEPEWDWRAWYNGDGSQSHGQEGCHFNWDEALDFYNNYMVPSLRSSSKLNGRVDLSVWECAQLNHPWLFNGFIENMFNSKEDTYDRWGRKTSEGFADENRNIRGYTNYLATHSYWCTEDDRRAVADTLNGSYYGQKVKCTEYCQMTNDNNTGVLGHIQNEGNTNGMTIDYGIAMADIMYQDLTTLNAVEWDWWTACAKGVYPDNLILINANDHSDIQTSKRYWCMGNFSKFVDVGAKRIQVDVASGFAQNLHTNRVYHWTFHDENNNITNEGDDKHSVIEQLAFLNPDGTVAIIYINNSDTIEYTRINGGNYTKFNTYVTSETLNLENVQSGNIDEAVCIPARSVTTVVLSN